MIAMKIVLLVAQYFHPIAVTGGMCPPNCLLHLLFYEWMPSVLAADPPLALLFQVKNDRLSGRILHGNPYGDLLVFRNRFSLLLKGKVGISTGRCLLCPISENLRVRSRQSKFSCLVPGGARVNEGGNIWRYHDWLCGSLARGMSKIQCVTISQKLWKSIVY